MGTITETAIGGYGILWSKNRIDPVSMTIFRERDRRGDADGDPGEIVYATSVRCVTDRLDVMGITLERCREVYEINRREEISTLEEGVQDDPTLASSAHELDVLRGLDFDRYREALRDAMRRGLHDYDDLPTDLADETRYALEAFDERPFGFFEDPRELIRVACSIALPDDEVTQDVGGLISSGWIEVNDRVAESSLNAITQDHPTNSPQILITEGSTDIEILKSSFELLFPHLVGYFTFFDFAGSKAMGGASQVIATMKAFAAARVSNRVIAVLDNDTAAHDAARAIAGVVLPKTMRLLHYPNLPMLRTYPTLGPAGLQHLDVNNAAGSLELYVGADILCPSEAKFPVQWRGYVASLKRYQGEVMGKERIMAAWTEKVRVARSSSDISSMDFSGVAAVWETILRAFR